MKVNIFKCLTLSLLLCSIQLLYAGRIYDEFEDTYKITWIGNSKLISGTTDDWAQRAGDIYRLKIDDPSNYSFLVYELPENEIAHEVIVDYYSPTGLRPTLAVKNSAGEETKYVEGWDNGYPEITDKGHGLYRCTLKDSLIPEDATQVVIYLDAQSDIELLRNIVYYGDGYQAKNYNEKTNYYRVQKLLEKAESGNDITIGVIGGSMTAGANAEPMETNCYGARLKTWFESTFGIDVNFINIGIGSTNSYFGCIRAEEKLLRFNPDLIIIEYACNDQLEDIYLDSYESLIRKCWKNPGEPAVISLMLCTQAGISKIERQYPIAQHCQIPIVSYNNAIKDEIIKGEKTWLDYYQTSTLIGGDGIHPNTTAHQKIADLIASFPRNGNTYNFEFFVFQQFDVEYMFSDSQIGQYDLVDVFSVRAVNDYGRIVVYPNLGRSEIFVCRAFPICDGSNVSVNFKLKFTVCNFASPTFSCAEIPNRTSRRPDTCLDRGYIGFAQIKCIF